MDLSAAIEKVFQFGKCQTVPVKFDLDLGPKYETYYIPASNEVKISNVPVALHDDEVLDLGSLVLVAANLKGRDDFKPTFYVSPRGVEVVVDDLAYRSEGANFPLQLSRAFKRLQKLDAAESPQWTDHDSFLRMLRTELEASESTEYVALQSLKFISGGEAASTVKHGTESLGRSVENRVLTGGSAAIPESITLSVPVFEQRSDITVEVSCFIEVQTREAKLALIPKAGQVREALFTELQAIGSDVAKLTAAVAGLEKSLVIIGISSMA
jgi:hypothetical protein